jgi:tRNA modification GTPase
VEANGSTICAVASAPGGSRRAVLRLSGPQSSVIVQALCPGAQLGARGLAPVELDDGVGTQPALLLWMPGPRSYTREDVAELHLLGSPPLLRAALDRALALGARDAMPGEFTRRAFLNGRLDLTRAEGVLELVSARSAEERRAATALLVGGLDGRVGKLRDRLEELRAVTEASLDFDETDTGHIPATQLAAAARDVLEGIEAATTWEARREPAAGLPRVVLAGEPNAGKSALFNALTDGQRRVPALVSAHAGTTRDAMAAAMWVGEVEVELVDTAGVEVPRGAADAAAQRTREASLRAADLVLGVVDATVGGAVAGAHVLAWSQVDREDARPAPVGAVPVSAVTGVGLADLGQAVLGALSGSSTGLGRELSARHLAALGEAAAGTRIALEGLENGLPMDLFAEGLRGATEALDRITGGTTPEDVLDRIFARFCLGK